MKALFALIIIYVGLFLWRSRVLRTRQCKPPSRRCVRPKTITRESIDPQKESDIRSLLELVGARDMIQDAASNSTEQYRRSSPRLRPAMTRHRKPSIRTLPFSRRSLTLTPLTNSSS